MNISDSTVERLEACGATLPLSVIDEVSQFAEYQAGFATYEEFLVAQGVTEPKVFSPDGNSSIEVVDITPKEWDGKTAVFYHTPHCNPLDKNQLYQIATIAGTNPEKRFIGIGSRCLGYEGAQLTRKLRHEVAKGNLGPLVDPAMYYAQSEKLERTDNVGTSKGAETALEQAARSYVEVGRVVAIEPVGPQETTTPIIRGLAMAHRFIKSGRALDLYVADSGLETFDQARAESITAFEFFGGLATPTNIAIFRGLARGGTEQRFRQALNANTEMIATLCWGSESELATDSRTKEMARRLIRDYRGEGRFRRHRLVGQKHAMPNDIHLQAALVKVGLT